MRVTVLQRDDDAYYFMTAGLFYLAQFHANPDRTFLSPARCVEGTSNLERAYGGVRVFTGHVEPQLMYEIVGFRDAARHEGFDDGADTARREIRKALGL